jgi:NDP-sugar pyrophosphorylase family protein
MALDISAVPAMSDTPEQSPRRRFLQSETLGWLKTLKTWINSGIITLDESLFDRLSSIVSADYDDVLFMW